MSQFSQPAWEGAELEQEANLLKMLQVVPIQDVTIQRSSKASVWKDSVVIWLPILLFLLHSVT